MRFINKCLIAYIALTSVFAMCYLYVTVWSYKIYISAMHNSSITLQYCNTVVNRDNNKRNDNDNDNE